LFNALFYLYTTTWISWQEQVIYNYLNIMARTSYIQLPEYHGKNKLYTTTWISKARTSYIQLPEYHGKNKLYTTTWISWQEQVTFWRYADDNVHFVLYQNMLGWIFISIQLILVIPVKTWLKGIVD
jgi:hypothetical protein